MANDILMVTRIEQGNDPACALVPANQFLQRVAGGAIPHHLYQKWLEQGNGPEYIVEQAGKLAQAAKNRLGRLEGGMALLSGLRLPDTYNRGE